MKRPAGFDGQGTPQPVRRTAEPVIGRNARESGAGAGAGSLRHDVAAGDPAVFNAPNAGSVAPADLDLDAIKDAVEVDVDVDVDAAVPPLNLSDALTASNAPPATSLQHSRQPDTDIKRAKQQLKRAEKNRKRRERNEQRRFTLHRRRRRRVAAVIAAAVLGVALFVAAGVFTPIMAVRDVEVRGAQAVNVADVQQSLSRIEGVPLALVQERDVHRALESFPLIQRYSIERIPPNTLVVHIEERVPAIAIKQEDSFDLLDPAGVVLARVPEVPPGVPVGGAELNDTSSPAFQAAATIVRDMPEDMRALLATVQATNGQDVKFGLSTGTEVIWGEPLDTQRKIAVLKALLAATGSPAMVDVSAPDAPVFR